jgi:hypothetical protein
VAARVGGRGVAGVPRGVARRLAGRRRGGRARLGGARGGGRLRAAARPAVRADPRQFHR